MEPYYIAYLPRFPNLILGHGPTPLAARGLDAELGTLPTTLRLKKLLTEPNRAPGGYIVRDGLADAWVRHLPIEEEPEGGEILFYPTLFETLEQDTAKCARILFGDSGLEAGTYEMFRWPLGWPIDWVLTSEDCDMGHSRIRPEMVDYCDIVPVTLTAQDLGHVEARV